MLDEDLLAFIVSTEKSGIILTGLPLYVTWPFSFAALNRLSLFCMFSVLIIFFLCQTFLNGCWKLNSGPEQSFYHLSYFSDLFTF